jgi:hypothetical protein
MIATQPDSNSVITNLSRGNRSQTAELMMSEIVNITPAKANEYVASRNGSPWLGVAPVNRCMVSGISISCAAAQNGSYQGSV